MNIKYLLSSFITIGILLITSCNILNDNTGNTDTAEPEVRVAYMPEAITGETTPETARTIIDVNTIQWKNFYVIPQIGHNYNSWVEHTVLPFVLQRFFNRDSMTRVDSSPYQLRWEQWNGDNLEAVFLTTNTFDHWTYIVKTGGNEIRQIMFQLEFPDIHILALYYRINEDNMNDVVEIIQSPFSTLTKCIRTYGINNTPDPSDTDAFMFNFASITNRLDSQEKTTGVMLSKNASRPVDSSDIFQFSDLDTNLNPASPGIFNNKDFLVAEHAVNTNPGYPDKNEVLNLAFSGINNADVAMVSINPETLESTLSFPEPSSGIPVYTGWDSLNYTDPGDSFGSEPAGDWKNLRAITDTRHNFENIRDQADRDIGNYLNGQNNMDTLNNNSDYSKEVYQSGNFRFQADDGFTKWKYTKNNGDEIRQLLYLKDKSVTPAIEYYYALFYRVNINDMNDLVVIKTSEDIHTDAATLKAYNISSGSPDQENCFFAQDLTDPSGNGTAIWDPDDIEVSLFNNDGFVEDHVTEIPEDFPPLQALSDFGNSITYKDSVATISIDTTNLTGGLELSEPY